MSYQHVGCREVLLHSKGMSEDRLSIQDPPGKSVDLACDLLALRSSQEIHEPTVKSIEL